ncbi:MAG: DEAD/DEAH box helicase [Candidatus Sericytochromatia bacterium]|nr:DEAD/DEAH box helicase [Candidatus Sericytochromatia bacterium]
MTFTAFDFRPELLKGILAEGYAQPTPIQAQAIPALLRGEDIIGCAQTGTGKTAAFALPLLQKLDLSQRQLQALIITPTRELAEQIVQNIRAYAQFMPRLRCLSIYGGVGINPQISELKKGAQIVVATPGRLLDHLQQKNLNLSTIDYLVLDEADRMLDMGFLPDVRRIMKQVPSELQTLLFSATMPPEIEKLARSFTRNAQLVMVAPRNTAAESVSQKMYSVEKGDKMALLSLLLSEQPVASAIVFSRTKHGADRIARKLARQNFAVARIHANRSQNQRQEALDGFRAGTYKILVATDIAARGIDVDGISHVINYDTPAHAEDYVHRIGRTGRAEATGSAWTFTSVDEAKYLQKIEKLIGKKIPRASLPDLSAFDEASLTPAVSLTRSTPVKSVAKASSKSPAKAAQPAASGAVRKSTARQAPRKASAQPQSKAAQKPLSERATRVVSGAASAFAAAEKAPLKPSRQNTGPSQRPLRTVRSAKADLAADFREPIGDVDYLEDLDAQPRNRDVNVWPTDQPSTADRRTQGHGRPRQQSAGQGRGRGTQSAPRRSRSQQRAH